MLTRNLPFEPGNSGLLIVDMQKLCCLREHAGDHGPVESYYERLDEVVVPNTKRLIEAFRARGIEVIYTVIQSLTKDGRDRSLDHKLSDYHVPKGSPLGEVIDAIAPTGDEIVIPKTSSGVFNSTNMEYVLRNIGIERLAIAGVYTSQCVDMAVRDAADRGFLVTLVEDCCASNSREAHEAAIETLSGYARVMTTDDVLARLEAQTDASYYSATNRRKG